MKELIKELNRIQKELKAPKNQYNNFGKYKYRSCEDIVEGVKQVIGDCILTVTDELVQVGDRYYIKATATIRDENNKISTTGYARESENKKGMDSSQLTGATSSYARKYALNGLFAIDDTKDADSTNKHGRGSTKTATKKSKTKSSTGITDGQMKAIYAISKSFGDSEKIKTWYKDKYSVKSSKDLTKDQASEIISTLKKKQEDKK